MSEVDNSKLDLYNLRNHSDFYHTIKYFDVTAKTNEVCKKKSNDVVKKIKNLKDTIILGKIRQILIDEYNSNYYDDENNVHETINLEEEIIIHAEDESFRMDESHVKNIIIFNNEMPIFNDFYLSFFGTKLHKKEKVKIRK